LKFYSPEQVDAPIPEDHEALQNLEANLDKDRKETYHRVMLSVGQPSEDVSRLKFLKGCIDSHDHAMMIDELETVEQLRTHVRKVCPVLPHIPANPDFNNDFCEYDKSRPPEVIVPPKSLGRPYPWQCVPIGVPYDDYDEPGRDFSRC
jgi:hypothetical protein